MCHPAKFSVFQHPSELDEDEDFTDFLPDAFQIVPPAGVSHDDSMNFIAVQNHSLKLGLHGNSATSPNISHGESKSTLSSTIDLNSQFAKQSKSQVCVQARNGSVGAETRSNAHAWKEKQHSEVATSKTFGTDCNPKTIKYNSTDSEVHECITNNPEEKTSNVNRLDKYCDRNRITSEPSGLLALEAAHFSFNTSKHTLSHPVRESGQAVHDTRLERKQSTPLSDLYTSVISPPEKKAVTENKTHSVYPRKRLFPGPAGLLPHVSTHLPESCRRALFDASQAFEDEIFKRPWSEMMKDISGDDNSNDLKNVITRFNIKWILKKARVKQLKGKVPLLCVSIKHINFSLRKEARAVFKDETGEIDGCIYRKLLEEYPGAIREGAVLVLKQVALLSATSRKPCLNVTNNNVVWIYFYDESDQVKRIAINNCTLSELHSFATAPLETAPTKQLLTTFSSSLSSPELQKTPNCSIQNPVYPKNVGKPPALIDNTFQKRIQNCSEIPNNIISELQKVPPTSNVPKTVQAPPNPIKPPAQSIPLPSLSDATSKLQKYKFSPKERTSDTSVSCITNSYSSEANQPVLSKDTEDYKWEDDGFEELLQSLSEDDLFKAM